MRKLSGLLVALVMLFCLATPVIAQSGGVHIVQPGENLSGIAARYGVDMWALARANGIVNPNTIYVGQRLTIPGTTPAPTPAPTGKVHVVQPGETLFSIARRYGVTVWALSQANGLYNMNVIYVGQNLVIPGTAVTPRQPSTGGGVWRGEYFNGTEPTGGPLFVRNDSAVNFHWGLCSPDKRLPCDKFSVRWARTINFRGGVYRFTMVADDGARIYVDDARVLDAWKVQPETTYTFDVTLTPGNHVITIEYFEDTGTATAQFSFVRVGNAPAATPCPGCGTPTGEDPTWTATYYGNPSLTDPAAATLTQGTVDFNWGSGGPTAGVPADGFSARWVRRVAFAGRTYSFCTKADDGIRLWLDDTLLVDEWHIAAGDVTLCRDVAMTAGVHTLRVEYYEDTGNALVKVWWQKR